VVDRDRWYYTGDLATVDSDGYVRIIGRKDDVVIRAGHKVVPLEVERVLEAHPGITRASVVGIPHELLGEHVWSFIVSKPGSSLDAGEIHLHCAERLLPDKLPDCIRIVEQLPLTDMGAVDKSVLRAWALADINARDEKPHGKEIT